MSATMARQGSRVQMEQSDMCLALNMAILADEGFSRATIGETQYLIKIRRAKVREENKRDVESPRDEMVKAAIDCYPAMLRQNHTSRCPPCQNGTASNRQTRWRRK